MTAHAHPANSRWYQSFYWRIVVSFAVLLAVVIVVQGVQFHYRMARSDQQASDRSPNTRSLTLATEIARVLQQQPDADLDAWLRARHREPSWPVYVVLADGRRATSAASGQFPLRVAQTADAVLGTDVASSGTIPGPGFSGMPVASAPINVDGALRGLVVLPPPAPSLEREVARWATWPSTLLLAGAAAVAALVIFLPARRRLAALEAATQRLAAGDLDTRAPEGGGDEIARVAHGFNQMAGELSRRDAALRTSDRLRKQMLEDVSHELKTPITCVLGYVETLQSFDSHMDEEKRAHCHTMLLRETRRLERLVADLVDLARYEHGVVPLSPRVFSIERLMAHVTDRHAASAAERKVTIDVAVQPDADQLVADPDRLEQVIDNLVANAIRHAPPDSAVVVRCSRMPENARIDVSDDGPGIAPEHLPYLFDRFYKADPSRASDTGGSGLGLSIAKAIVERHGGHIDVESRPGHTTFHVVFPQDDGDGGTLA